MYLLLHLIALETENDSLIKENSPSRSCNSGVGNLFVAFPTPVVNERSQECYVSLTVLCQGYMRNYGGSSLSVLPCSAIFQI